MADIKNIPINEHLRVSNPKVNQNFQNINTEVTNHVSNQYIHVTTEEKNNWNSKAPGSIEKTLQEHISDTVVHVTKADHDKINGIEPGAEINQNAFSKVNDINATLKTDTVTFKGGTGISVTSNPLNKEIEITATGTSTPGPHGTSHLEHGSDPIPLATETDGGLMSAADKQAVNSLNKTRDGKKYTLNNPYARGGSLALKGQLHCHTTNSDGANSPTELVTAYKDAGYDFMTITDHNFITPDPGVGGITWIGNSVEETYPRHIVSLNVADRVTDTRNTQGILDYHHDRGEMTDIAHPYWPGNYIIDKLEIQKLNNFNFVEVYNAVVNQYGEVAWDNALSVGKRTFGIAVDDCHNSSISSQFNAGWVVVFADTNTKEAILSALRAGNFYASTGADVSISLVGNTMTANSSFASTIQFIGRDGRILKQATNTNSASYTILGDELYIRVKVIRISDGKMAWSNPVFIEISAADGEIISDTSTANHSGDYLQQSLINGNFDVWQRGTLLNNPPDRSYLADRWQLRCYPGVGGTAPSGSLMQRWDAPGAADIEGISSFLRYVVNSGTTFGTDTYFGLQQFIENGTRKLCGYGKKVTISFYARSTVPGKKLGISLRQAYKEDTEPGYSPFEDVKGTYVTLTDYWKKYVVTIETNEIINKQFSPKQTDYLRLNLGFSWGTNYKGWFNAEDGEGFSGPTELNFAKIQLSSGDKELPFKEYSFAEELKRCERYYHKSCYYDDLPSHGSYALTSGYNTTLNGSIRFPVAMRKIPSIQISSDAGKNKVRKVNDGSSVVDVTGSTPLSISRYGMQGIMLPSNSFDVGSIYSFDIEADAEY